MGFQEPGSQLSIHLGDGGSPAWPVSRHLNSTELIQCAVESAIWVLAAPVMEVGAGQDEHVALVAVQVLRAGTAVDDGLEGAEAALG
ncbi:hypothetical protein [Streptomyces sp. NBC_01750]|uniref:hypothetical protein n=1 Tax=Streptomyces sp. NBC_01750 TaxID=2975928 RepID=UPI002DDC234E|nr:hypothetical protein [Streptomyces sp. NBC_01750]WSD37275.1 hypothetical protein OG966_38430 [Streptomyces sp. NBC_01750]